MKKIVLLLLLTTLGWSSKILGYNVHDRYDHVDVVLRFDTPYKGKVTQAYEEKAIFVEITEASITPYVDLNVSSSYLTALHLYPKDPNLILKADVPEKIFLTSSQSSDGYTLRLRFAQHQGDQTIPPTNEHPIDTTLPISPASHSPQTFVSILTIVGLGLAMALTVVIGVRRKEQQEDEPLPPHEAPFFSSPFTEIRFQKVLDSSHTAVMIHTHDYEYLLLLGGGTSLLLDTFVGGYPMTYDEFESLLRYHYSELKPFFTSPSVQEEP